MLKKFCEQFFVSVILSLCMVFLLGTVVFGADFNEVAEPTTTAAGTAGNIGTVPDILDVESVLEPTSNNLFKFRLVDGEYKAVPVDSATDSKQDGKVNAQGTNTLRVTSAYPNFFQLWGRSSIYWYHPDKQMIYLGVANCVKYFPDDYIKVDGIPTDSNVFATLNSVPLTQDYNLRHRALSYWSPKPSSPLSYPVRTRVYSGSSYIEAVYYIAMGQSSGHIGYITFYPICSIAELATGATISGTFEASYHTGALPSYPRVVSIYQPFSININDLWVNLWSYVQ